MLDMTNVRDRCFRLGGTAKLAPCVSIKLPTGCISGELVVIQPLAALEEYTSFNGSDYRHEYEHLPAGIYHHS